MAMPNSKLFEVKDYIPILLSAFINMFIFFINYLIS